jgi:REP element-mobilizing transposase RayT
MKYEFGGVKLLKKSKSLRPLSFHNSTHLVLRLKDGLPLLFDPHDKRLKKHINQMANKYQIRIYHLIFNHTHMHAAILLSNRKFYVSFIRELTAFLVKYFTDQLKIPGLILKNIFAHRPYTRSVVWGKAYRILVNYMKKNELESGVQQMAPAQRPRSSKNQKPHSAKILHSQRVHDQLWLRDVESG